MHTGRGLPAINVDLVHEREQLIARARKSKRRRRTIRQLESCIRRMKYEVREAMGLGTKMLPDDVTWCRALYYLRNNGMALRPRQTKYVWDDCPECRTKRVVESGEAVYGYNIDDVMVDPATLIATIVMHCEHLYVEKV